MIRRAAFAIAALLAPPAFAQPPAAPAPPPAAQPDDGTSTVVAELEVVAKPPGPAMWRVKKGASEVVILGAISPLGHRIVWDRTRVQHALESAHVLLTPPEPQVKVWDVPALLFKMNALKTRTALQSRLPPAERDRFLNAVRMAGQQPKRYEGYKPAAAGARLVADYREAAGLSNAKPASTVERLAKAAHVPIRPLAQVRALPLLDGLARLDDAQQLTCLDAAIADVEWEAGHAKAAGEAWAQGHIAEARAGSASPALERCALQLPNVNAMVERGTADATRAISAALTQPGRSVAVVDLRYLTRANGLLDRLKAQGAEISVPVE